MQIRRPSPKQLTEIAAGRTLHLTSYEMLWQNGTIIFKHYVRVMKISAADTATGATFTCILQEMQVLRLCGAIPTPHLQLPRVRYGMDCLSSFYLLRVRLLLSS